MAAHNTNVTDLYPPYGGYPKFVEQGLNDDWLPIWLQEAGYNTYYTGKLWNAHSVDNYNDPYVKGFNSSDFILDPSTYNYLDAHMTRDGAPPVSYKGQYSPDVVAQKAYDYLDEATLHDEPFFLAVAPIAPHSHVEMDEKGLYFIDKPKYAERHAHLFKDYKIPRTAQFNPETPVEISWMKDLPRLNDTVIEYNDEFQRSRLRALQSVDEMVEQLVKKLDQKGLLDDTYIFYTTDNGYHISQFRLHPGKECGFDTDIHIPLIVRGPGVQAGHISEAVTSHTDLAPTIMSLAGTTRPTFDGAAIDLGDDEKAEKKSEHVNIEFWGIVAPEGIYGRYGNHTYKEIPGNDRLAINNTYKGLRVIGEDYNVYYSVWCSGEKQYYDLKLDPYQVDNYFTNERGSSYTLAGQSLSRVLDRLDALMMVLKSCKGRECTHPWEVLHPEGGITTLKDALSKDYNVFYAEQPKVKYDSCQLGYIREQEGPQKPHVFGPPRPTYDDTRVQKSFVYKGDWSIWT